MSELEKEPTPAIPPDDLARTLSLVRPETDTDLPHIGLVGDTYTIVLTGNDTKGHFCLIDMFVPVGGGPPPHRHDSRRDLCRDRRRDSCDVSWQGASRPHP
jgi:hypothetical protein